MFKIISLLLIFITTAQASCLKTDQILLSLTDSLNDKNATVTLFNRTQKGWEPTSSKITAVIGKNGMQWGKSRFHKDSLPEKKEGDGKSPMGAFKITKTFGYFPALQFQYKTDSPLEHLHVDKKSVCIDDIHSKYYNQVILDETTVKKDWNSHEKMKRDDYQYRFGALVEHNHRNLSGKGSCIFLHIWEKEGSGTAGCTAMEEVYLKDILEKLDASKKPLLVQLTKKRYQKLKKSWCLP